MQFGIILEKPDQVFDNELPAVQTKFLVKWAASDSGVTSKLGRHLKINKLWIHLQVCVPHFQRLMHHFIYSI